MRQRSEYRSLLLSELNSVIAHRLNETREREKRALLKSKGVPAVASTGETKRSDETQEKKEVGQYEFAREEGEMTPDRCTPMEAGSPLKVLHDTLQGTDAPLLVDTESKSDSAMGAPNFPGSTADVLMKSQLDVYDRHSHDSSICDESETIGDKNGFELISGAQNLFPPPKGLLNEPTDGLRPPDHLPNLPFSPNLDQVIRHRRPLEETFDEVATGEDAYDDPTSEVSLPTNP
ncbi:unnamed protein product [Schistocephalus solidus]|uniref:Uncharacterized protein n=1 Tax=Schistocephalus solidus TaxID=70667 RepID=A0A3P7CF09_SCHSO|nr:unnamed protein product [Schistocephalus solidus]